MERPKLDKHLWKDKEFNFGREDMGQTDDELRAKRGYLARRCDCGGVSMERGSETT